MCEMDQHIDEEYSTAWNTQNSLEANYSQLTLSPSQSAPCEGDEYYEEPTLRETGTANEHKQAEYEGEELLSGHAIEQQYGEHQYFMGHWQRQINQQDEQLAFVNGLIDATGVDGEVQDEPSLEAGPSDSVAAVYGGYSPPTSQAETQQECTPYTEKPLFPDETAMDDSSFSGGDNFQLKELAAQLVDSLGGIEAKKKVDEEIEVINLLHQQLQFKAISSMTSSLVIMRLDFSYVSNNVKL